MHVKPTAGVLQIWTARIVRALGAAVLFFSFSAPKPAQAGINKWTTNGPGTGAHLTSVVFDPTDPSTIYVTAGRATGNRNSRPNGGVFKSTDAGSSWRTLTSGLSNQVVNLLVVDPVTPTTLYVATDGGVAKSTDAGLGWRDTGLVGAWVEALAVDQTAPQTLYAGTSGAVLRSTDGGERWMTSLLPEEALVVFALALDPHNPRMVYAATNGGVLTSTDAAATWTRRGPDDSLNSVLIDPADSQHLLAAGSRVYVSTRGGRSWQFNLGLSTFILAFGATGSDTVYAGTFDGLWKTTDTGTTWQRTNQGMPPASSVYALAVDPGNPDTVYAGTSLDDCGGLFISTDGGNHWAPTALNTARVQAIAIAPTMPQAIYAGRYCGGLFKSTDLGMTWHAAQTGLTSGPFIMPSVFALAVDPQDPDVVFAGGFDGVFKSSDGGTSWRSVNNGLRLDSVTALFLDPSTSGTLYAVGHGERDVFKSTDGGDSWRGVGAGFGASSLAGEPGATIYAGSSADVGLSTDGGASWVRRPLRSPILPMFGVSDIEIDAVAPRTAYAATDVGVFKTTDAGNAWDRLDTSPFSIQALLLESTTPTTLYATTSGSNPRGLFRSTDAGASWDAFSLGVLPGNVFALAADAAGTVYVGALGGSVLQRTPSSGCPGDCDGSGEVSIADVVSMMNIALGDAPPSSCPRGDINGSGAVTIDEILQAVAAALYGCG